MFINAATPKCWDTYSIHIIEPTLKLLYGFYPDFENVEINATKKIIAENRRHVQIIWDNGAAALFSSLGKVNCAITIQLIGNKGSVLLTFKSTFLAFRAALESFLGIIRQKIPGQSKELVFKTISIIEKGLLHD